MNVGTKTDSSVRWIRPLCFAPILSPVIVVFILGSFPFPGDNSPPEKILHYTLSHRTVEIQSLLWFVMLAAMLVVFLLLALAYHEREKRLTLWVLLLAAAATCFVLAQLMALAVYLVIPLFFRGFAASAPAPALADYSWDMANAIFTTSFVFGGLAWWAVFMANRSRPILPPALGRYGAAVVALLCFAGQSSLFFDSGPWSPTSTLSFLLTGSFPTLIWIFLLGVLPPSRWIPSLGTTVVVNEESAGVPG
jgi:hypothetical protein